jgi:hypothetical protein
MQPNDAAQAIKKQGEANLQTSRWKEIIKIRAEINEIETKRMIQ